MVELHHVVASAREIDTLVNATHEERNNNHYCDSGNHCPSLLGLSEEVNSCAGKEVAAESCCKCVCALFLLQQCLKHKARDKHCCEERADDAYEQCSCEALDQTCTVNHQDDSRDYRSKVRVEDSRECILVTVSESGFHVLAGTEFLLGALEDKHVGIDSHTERKHDTADTRQRQHCLERSQDSESEEEVEHQAHVGHHSRSESVERNHIYHQQNQCNHKRPDTSLNCLLTE